MVENPSNHHKVPSVDWTNIEASSRTGLKKKKKNKQISTSNSPYPSSDEDTASSDHHHHQKVQSVEWTNEASTRTMMKLKQKKNLNSPYPSSDEDAASDQNNDNIQIECSGQNCKSCSATVLADCVAICCCPCAVVNFLTLTLVKVPFTMGRRCLRIMKKKCILSGKKNGKRKGNDKGDHNCGSGGNYMNNKEKWLAPLDLDGNWEIPNVLSTVVPAENFCARFEAERVWLEFYQVGHLGFGRVSFTGIPAKGN